MSLERDLRFLSGKDITAGRWQKKLEKALEKFGRLDVSLPNFTFGVDQIEGDEEVRFATEFDVFEGHSSEIEDFISDQISVYENQKDDDQGSVSEDDVMKSLTNHGSYDLR